MSMMESVAYLKGLAHGLDINETTKEGKLLLAIVDVLDEMAESIGDIEDVCEEFDELIDVIDEDLGDLEEDFYGLEDDDDCCCGDDCDCGCNDEDDEDFFDEDDELYEVTCPNCNDVIYLNEEMLLDGDMDCPNCQQKLEFDFDDCCCGDDCDCGSSSEEE